MGGRFRLRRELDPSLPLEVLRIPEGALPSVSHRFASLFGLDQGFEPRNVRVLEFADRELAPLRKPSDQLVGVRPARPLRRIRQANDPSDGVVLDHVLALEQRQRIPDELRRSLQRVRQRCHCGSEEARQRAALRPRQQADPKDPGRVVKAEKFRVIPHLWVYVVRHPVALVAKRFNRWRRLEASCNFFGILRELGSAKRRLD